MANTIDPFLQNVQWNPGYGPNGPTNQTSNPATPPSTGAPVGTGQQPPNPNPAPTPGNATGNPSPTPTPSQFTGYVKSDSSPTVYGVDANGNYTAFSNENDFLASGGNFANVKTINGFNPGVVPIYNSKQPAPTSGISPISVPGFGNVPMTSQGVPDYYALQKQILANYGIGTGTEADPLKQLEETNLQIASDQQVLAPLQISHFQTPASLAPLTEGGANQAQLDLKAAQAAAPIQTALGFLIQSRSALGDYISNAQSVAGNLTQAAQTSYETQLKMQQYDFQQIGTHVNELGQTVPDYGYVNGFTGKILPATQPNSQDITQPTYNVNGIPVNLATRPSPSNPNVIEYYNPVTNQPFSNPQQLADYVNKVTNSNVANASNVFSLLNGSQNHVDQITSSVSNSRTDRNNNPIAASVAVNSNGTPNMGDPTTNEWLTALNKAGVDYTIEQGNNFSGNRATINFATPSDGIAGAKVLLGTSAFYWYKNNTGKSELANVSSPTAFKTLSDSQKTSIVKGIYSHEQPGGQLFNAPSSSSSISTNTNIQQQIAALPPVMQKYIHTSPTGYAYTGASTPDTFTTAIAANKNTPDITPLSPSQAEKEDALVTGLGLIQQASDLVNTLHLPTDPYDPTRVKNLWDQTLGNNPQLAQLNQYWQAAIQTLQGLGATGLRSNALIDKAANTDFPNGGSIDSVAKAQLANIKAIVQTEERTVFGGRLSPVDYQSQANNLLQGSVTNGSDSTYDSLNQLYNGLFVAPLDTSNINILPPQQ